MTVCMRFSVGHAAGGPSTDATCLCPLLACNMAGGSLPVLELRVIRHIVFFTVSETNLAEARAGLQRLGEIPHAKLFEVGVNLKRDLYANEVDLVVYAEFETVADLDAYKAHPLYGDVTEAVRPLRNTRAAADFESVVAHS